jgi:cold shock CspA family protein
MNDTLLKTATSFEEYLMLWGNYLKDNNTHDWNDDEDETEELKAEEKTSNIVLKTFEITNDFKLVTNKKKRSTYKKEPTNNLEFRGKILKWFPDKNFGFIICKNITNKDIFCHGSNLSGSPRMGSKIKINVTKNKKGDYVISKGIIYN